MAQNEVNYEQEIRNHQNQMRSAQEQFIRDCEHKPGGGKGKVMSIHDYNGFIQNKDKYSPTTAICTRCGAIFEAESFQPEEINSGIYMFSSMLHQIKMNAQLSADDKQNIAEAFRAIETLSGIANYYNNMVEKLAGGGNKNGNKRGRGKGHIGLDSSMMGSRSYNGQ